MSDIGGIYQWRGSDAISAAKMSRFQFALNWYRATQQNFWYQNECGLISVFKPFTPEDVHDHQPLGDTDANIRLVAVARLDYRDTLCEKLNIPTHERPFTSDSNLILSAYNRWGTHCASQLEGDFAFALWDGKRQQLVCARDQRGMVPFFYHYEEGKQLCFATSMQGVLAASGVSGELDQQMLADRLTYNASHDSNRTFYQGVHALRPANCLVANRNGIRITPYWQWDTQRQLSLKHDDDYVEAFRELFFAAVHSRMRSQQPIGAHLSGGLDSSSVAAVAAMRLKRMGKTLPTFTQVPSNAFDFEMPPGVSADDRDLIKRCQTHHGNIESTLVSIDNLQPGTHLDRFFDWSYMPPINPFNRLWIEAIYQRASNQGLGALLTGEKGNLTVSKSGKANYIDERLQHGQWLSLWRELARYAQINKISTLRALASHLNQRKGLGRLLRNPLANEQEKGANRFIHSEFASRMEVHRRLRETRQAGWSHIEELEKEMQRRRLHTANQLPVFNHAYSNGFGIRSLDPTNDIRIVEFCQAVPSDQNFHQGWDRALIRRTMHPYLPSQLIWRTDRGRQAADWMLCLDKAKASIEDDIQSMKSSALASEVLNLPAMMSTLQRWHCGNTVYQNSEYLFHLELMRSWLVGRFILWSERRQSVAAAA